MLDFQDLKNQRTREIMDAEAKKDEKVSQAHRKFERKIYRMAKRLVGREVILYRFRPHLHRDIKVKRIEFPIGTYQELTTNILFYIIGGGNKFVIRDNMDIDLAD